MPDEDVQAPLRRFLKLEEVARLFSTSQAQVYALVRRGDLAAIKLGGRGQYRVELNEIEAYIERQYEATRSWVEAHPFNGDASDGTESEPEEGFGLS